MSAGTCTEKVLALSWIPQQQRFPAGVHQGGEFEPKGGGASSPTVQPQAGSGASRTAGTVEPGGTISGAEHSEMQARATANAAATVKAKGKSAPATAASKKGGGGGGGGNSDKAKSSKSASKTPTSKEQKLAQIKTRIAADVRQRNVLKTQLSQVEAQIRSRTSPAAIAAAKQSTAAADKALAAMTPAQRAASKAATAAYNAAHPYTTTNQLYAEAATLRAQIKTLNAAISLLQVSEKGL